jgi:hypothetical protein
LLSRPTEDIVRRYKDNPFLRSKVNYLLKTQPVQTEKPVQQSKAETEEELSTFKNRSSNSWLKETKKLSELKKQLGEDGGRA